MMPRRILVVLLLFLVSAHAALVPVEGQAQSISGTPQDLDFEVINATSGEPGTIDRLVLQYEFGALRAVLDIEPLGSEFTVRDVPVKDGGRYVLTAWSEDVPYYWSLRGRDLLEKPVTLHIFSTASNLDDVAIVGLDLLLRKTESLLELEYMLQVENRARPQVTIKASPALTLAIPAGATTATLSHGNGPEPEIITLENPGSRAVLSAPLTTGRNPMRLKISLPYEAGMQVPVGANVPIEKWSLLATPATLDIQSFDLEPASLDGLDTHARFRGPEVAAGDDFFFKVFPTAGAGQEEDLFTRPADQDTEGESTTTEKTEEDGGFPFVVLLPILVVIIVFAALRRRR